MRATGFTLIELLIAILVVALLAAIGYPAYTSQLDYGRRTDAQRILLEEANRLERHFAAQGQYPADFTPKSTEYYDLSYKVDDPAVTYLLSAKPKHSNNCGTLTVNQSGATTPVDGNCWK